MSNFSRHIHCVCWGSKFKAVNIAIEKAQLISESVGRNKAHWVRIGHSLIPPPLLNAVSSCATLQTHSLMKIIFLNCTLIMFSRCDYHQNSMCSVISHPISLSISASQRRFQVHYIFKVFKSLASNNLMWFKRQSYLCLFKIVAPSYAHHNIVAV